MRTTIMKAALAATLIGGLSVSAYALDVSVGGGSGSGGVAGVSTGNVGGTGTSVSVGNTSGPLATIGNANGNTSGQVNLGGANSSGPLVSGGSNDGTTNATVNGLGNLGGLLGGIAPGGVVPGGPGNGGGTINVSDAERTVGGLSSGDRQALRLRCSSILAAPGSFDPTLVQLCRIVAKVR